MPESRETIDKALERMGAFLGRAEQEKGRPGGRPFYPIWIQPREAALPPAHFLGLGRFFFLAGSSAHWSRSCHDFVGGDGLFAAGGLFGFGCGLCSRFRSRFGFRHRLWLRLWGASASTCVLSLGILVFALACAACGACAPFWRAFPRRLLRALRLPLAASVTSGAASALAAAALRGVRLRLGFGRRLRRLVRFPLRRRRRSPTARSPCRLRSPAMASKSAACGNGLAFTAFGSVFRRHLHPARCCGGRHGDHDDGACAADRRRHRARDALGLHRRSSPSALTVDVVGFSCSTAARVAVFALTTAATAPAALAATPAAQRRRGRRCFLGVHFVFGVGVDLDPRRPSSSSTSSSGSS